MATTIRITPKLKARVAKLAKHEGKTPHAFMLEAIERRVEDEEKHQEFLDEGERRWEEFQRTGMGYAAEDVHRYVEALARGEKPERPKLRKWK